MNFDIGRALLGALGGAGSAVEQMGQQQQKQQDAQQTAQMNEQAWEARQKFLEGENPPPSKDVAVADPNNPGSNVIQHQVWDYGDGEEKPQYLVDSTANDPKTEGLQNRADQASAALDVKREQLAMQGELGQARIDAASARLAAQQAKGDGPGKLIQKRNADGTSTYGYLKDGQFSPAMDDQGNPLTSNWYRQRQGLTNTIKLADESTLRARSADAIGPASPVDPYGDRPDVSQMPSTKTSPQVTFVDPSASGAPLSQLSTTRSTNLPHPSSGDTSSVVRTTPYPDGTSLIGPNGQRYVVHNGVPVPDGG